MIPATIPYVGAVALAKAVGVSTAGLSAIEISNAITQKIQENPEVLNTPQAKGIAFAMGINYLEFLHLMQKKWKEKDKE